MKELEEENSRLYKVIQQKDLIIWHYHTKSHYRVNVNVTQLRVLILMKMINLNNISEFKQSYSKALTNGDDMFVFEGSDVLTSYAKYVIEYFNFKK